MKKFTVVLFLAHFICAYSNAQEAEEVRMNPFEVVAKVYFSTKFETESDVLIALSGAAASEFDSENIEAVSTHVFSENGKITSGHGVFRHDTENDREIEEVLVFLSLRVGSEDEEQWDVKLSRKILINENSAK